MRSIALNLDKDIKIIAEFDDNGYTKLNDVQIEAGWKVTPSKWLRSNAKWVKNLVPSHTYQNPYFTHRFGKDKGTYVVDKILLAYVADNDNLWKQSLIELLYSNMYSGDAHRGTYYSDSIAVQSNALANLKRCEERFNCTIGNSNPDIAMKLKIDFIQWITGDTNTSEGESKIINGFVPGVTVYASLLNRASTYFTLTPTYEGVSRLMTMAV